MVSAGAEAMTPQAEEDAEDHDWHIAKRFPLHLYPQDTTSGLTIDREYS
jgi:hypothetical protein